MDQLLTLSDKVKKERVLSSLVVESLAEHSGHCFSDESWR